MVAGLFSALGNIAGSWLSNSMSTFQMEQMAKYQAALNYKYAKKTALEMPALNRQGIEAAGYNPMLALGNLHQAENSWSQLANPTTPDMSHIGSNAVEVTNALRQQNNQDRITDSQIENSNADTVLKTQQSTSEQVNQILAQAKTDYEKAKTELTKKDISNYERVQAREDLKVNGYLQQIANDFKIQSVRNAIDQQNSVTNRIVANSNATDVRSRIPINKQEAKIRKWNARHPVLSRLLPGSASSAISAGSALLK